MALASRRSTRIALAAAGVVVLLLVLAQLLLPTVAARIARGQIEKYGPVRSVSVHAFPAIELLWGHAQSARIDTGELRMSVSQFDGLLPRLRSIERVDMTIAGLALGSLRAQHVHVSTRGDALQLQATVTTADVQSALPPGIQATLVPSPSGGGVAIHVTGSLFGIGASLLATLAAQEGKLIAAPQGVPFASFARVTVFSDPHVFVQDVALASGPGAGDYTLTLRATLL